MEDFKVKLKIRSTSNLQEVFDELIAIINPSSALFNEFIHLMGSYNDNIEVFNLDIASLEERNKRLAKIRLSLLELIDKIKEGDIKISTTTICEEKSVAIIEENEDETGYLDHMMTALDNFNKLSICVTDMASFTNEWTEDLKNKTISLKNINQLPEQARLIQGKKLMLNLAHDLNKYNQNMLENLPLFKELTTTCIKSYFGAIGTLYIYPISEEQVPELIIAENQVIQIKDAYLFGKEGLEELRQSLEKLPNYETSFNKSKKQTVNILKETCSIMEDFVSSSQNTLNYIDKLLNKNTILQISTC